ncbi:beta-ketoacyl-ACP synthase III [Prevotella sp. ne3005]|uniref:beta-ketoacyl-ACP synthase III n=1 Tax=Prevotella sp. ne3005 TaxID=1761887 RepID=UPI0021D522EA|nr:beta-ketoacyl-ACP synthase III [Prevotella sp. ne3005]
MDVFITKASRFLPNDPVENDDMEAFLGMVDGKPSKARRVILRRNGIKQRYYALDKDGNVTHTNVQMAANAVRGLLDDQLTIDDIDLLSCGTGSPEQLIPSHGVMVHGELGGKKHMEVVSFAGSCCSGADALKYAYMAVKLGLSKNAVAVASERSSAWMRASYFQKESEQLAQLEDQPMLAFQKDFLRWMLSDGAFSVLLQGKPSASGLSLRLDWIDITSYANTKETCMYAAADKDADGRVKGWASFPQSEWLTESIFAIKQDTRMLSEYIVPLGVQYLIEMGKKHQFTPDDVDWFLPHMSSMFFKDVIIEESAKQGFAIPEERWFYNLPKIGNIGSASAFAMLEELMDSGLLKQGQKVLVMVPESARFSYCYFMLTVC